MDGLSNDVNFMGSRLSVSLSVVSHCAEARGGAPCSYQLTAGILNNFRAPCFKHCSGGQGNS